MTIAHSIYRSAASHSSHFRHHSSASILSKQLEVAAYLAAKEAEYEVSLKENSQKEKIAQLEEQQRRAERLQVKKELKAACVRFSTYILEVTQGTRTTHKQQPILPAPMQQLQTVTPVSLQQQPVSQPQPMSSTLPQQQPVSMQQPQQLHNVTVTAPSSPMDIAVLAHALQDNMLLNRLPTPEPAVFAGDQIQYTEWRTTFISLIDRQNIMMKPILMLLNALTKGMVSHS